MSKGLKEGTLLLDNDIDEFAKEIEEQEQEGDYDINQIINEDAQEEEDDLGVDLEDEEEEEEEDEGMDNGLEELDPQVLKLQERIKFLSHRCIASLGNNLYEKAYNFLKSNNCKNADEVRENLLNILGPESIGFWAILDQIMFFESVIDEISTIDSSP
mmetsp:Transcript_28629/g.27616  ORF Transcript_28629/g.27616 Transcript_28629/m.27616 type:complete len:158 (+) Transcript_28629:1684-2157(+)